MIPKKRSLPGKYTLTTDWKIDEFIQALNKRSVEFSLGVDATSKGNSITFVIRHRSKDKSLLQALLKTLYGTVKQG